MIFHINICVFMHDCYLELIVFMIILFPDATIFIYTLSIQMAEIMGYRK